ncbi:hypothetical protein WJX77_002615 [Trebouxia sp. C0004]
MSGHTCFSPGTLICQHNHPYSRPAVRSGVSSKAVCDESRRILPTTLLARSPSQSPSKSHCGRYSSQKSKCQCTSRPEHQSQQKQIPLHIIAVITAAVSLSAPAWAELQTVPSSQATQYAKPIQKQKVDKGFVALLFAGGAASLFGSAVLLEKNARFFPAIYKANQVMREAEKRNQGRAIAEQAVVDLEQQDEMRLQRSVEAGLANAQARVLPESSNGTSTSSNATNVDTDDGTSEDSNAQTSSNANDHSQQKLHSEDHDDTSFGSSPERAKGSQLSAAEKQNSAIKSVS